MLFCRMLNKCREAVFHNVAALVRGCFTVHDPMRTIRALNDAFQSVLVLMRDTQFYFCKSLQSIKNIMRRFTFLLFMSGLLIVPGMRAFAQQSSVPDQEINLFGNNNSALGGYISFGMGGGNLNGHNALLIQGRAAVRFAHSLSLGVAGTGFSDFPWGLNYDRSYARPGGYYLEGGYGGLMIEPVLASHFPVHLTFPIVMGAGFVALTRESDAYDWFGWDDYSDRVVIDSAPFLIVEPGVEMEINLISVIRLGVGAGYRFATPVRFDRGPEYPVNGLGLTASLKLGIF